MISSRATAPWPASARSASSSSSSLAADNGVVLRSSVDHGQPTQLTLLPGTEMTGMITGIEGMKVGGRRVITVPYMDAFGERGFPTGGLPAETDVVVVVDLLGVYL